MLKLLKTREGQIVVSVILGFGLATLFRRVCTGRSCFVIKGPKLSEVKDFVYRIDDRCYKYRPRVVECTETKDGADEIVAVADEAAA